MYAAERNQSLIFAVLNSLNDQRLGQRQMSNERDKRLWTFFLFISATNSLTTVGWTKRKKNILRSSSLLFVVFVCSFLFFYVFLIIFFLWVRALFSDIKFNVTGRAFRAIDMESHVLVVTFIKRLGKHDDAQQIWNVYSMSLKPWTYLTRRSMETRRGNWHERNVCEHHATREEPQRWKSFK